MGHEGGGLQLNEVRMTSTHHETPQTQLEQEILSISESTFQKRKEVIIQSSKPGVIESK